MASRGLRGRNLPVVLRPGRYVLLQLRRHHLTTLYSREVMNLGWGSGLLLTGVLEVSCVVGLGKGSLLELGYPGLQDLDHLSFAPELGLEA